jgi:hypothetical protein
MKPWVVSSDRVESNAIPIAATLLAESCSFSMLRRQLAEAGFDPRRVEATVMVHIPASCPS